MKRSCHKCELDITCDEPIITCKGFCEEIRRYHLKCVELSQNDQKTCHSRNIFWMCDECCQLMSNKKFRNIINGWRSSESKTESEVECLRNDVSKLSESLSNIMESLQNQNLNSINESPSLVSSPSSKDTSKDSQERFSSTRLFGLNQRDSLQRTTNGSYAEESRKKLKLHLSNIAVDVTEAEVAEMVGEALGIDRAPIVKSLVPSWMDSSSLEFVSFKVEIDSCHKSRALNPLSWPGGVRCREFREFARDVWRPMTRSR